MDIKKLKMSFAVDKIMVQDLLTLKSKYDFSIIVETGTETGKSCHVLKNIFNKIYTCEINKGYKKTHNDLLNNSKIKLLYGKSSDCLRLFFDEIGHDNFFLYLDAHSQWDYNWPILDELKVVKEYNFKPIILIHDFDCEVQGWRYEKYTDENGISHELNWDYIKESIIDIYGENGFILNKSNKSTLNSGMCMIHKK
jgi:hypothetical protein